MDKVDVIIECNMVNEDNTEAVPVECTVLFDVNGDEVSNNDDDENDGIRLEGDDVKCSDEDEAGLDEKLSVDSVVMVTKLGLPLGIVVKETAREKVLLADVGEGSTDESVACDEGTTGSEVLRTDENEDDNLVVESDCCIEDESAVAILLVSTDGESDCCIEDESVVAILLVSTDGNSDTVEDDIGCEVLVLVLTWSDVSGTEDSSLVV